MATSTSQHAFHPDLEVTRLSFRRTLMRVSAVIVGLAVLVVAIGVLFKEPDPDVEPNPEIIRVQVPDEMRSRLLSPEVRDFLVKMESGQVSGHLETEFETAFRQATEIKDEGRFRTYRFAVGKIDEEHPVIFVRVQKRSGRIVFCSVFIPEW